MGYVASKEIEAEFLTVYHGLRAENGLRYRTKVLQVPMVRRLDAVTF